MRGHAPFIGFRFGDCERKHFITEHTNEVLSKQFTRNTCGGPFKKRGPDDCADPRQCFIATSTRDKQFGSLVQFKLS